MKIAIRVDSSREMGTGHVRRSLSLAQALRTCGAAVRIVTRILDLDAAAVAARAGFESFLLPAPTGQPISSAIPHASWAGVEEAVDAAETAEVLRGWAPDWVVIDHYAFGANWHQAVCSELECRIAAIDDLADRALSVDLLVDHNYAVDSRAKYAGRIGAATKVLGGPRFALLDPAFAEAPRYAPNEAVRSIGIFMGGVDRDNVTALVLDAIGEACFPHAVEIVTTSANPHRGLLEVAAAARPDTSVLVDLPNLADFFGRHDLQIGAGGGATWERCCLGSPTLLLIVAQNQLAVVPELAEQGYVVTPEPRGTLSQTDIAAAIRALVGDPELRHRLAERSRNLVDGRGALRVALRMLVSEVTVRPATREDAEIMYRWRNHRTTREASRHAEEIDWESHLAWTERTLADPYRTLMVGVIGSVPIGIIRLDRLNAAQAEVSLYLDPALHGLGLGRAMLLAGEAAATAGLDILAEVLDGNVGSANLFESAGYRRVDANHWIKSVENRA